MVQQVRVLGTASVGTATWQGRVLSTTIFVQQLGKPEFLVQDRFIVTGSLCTAAWQGRVLGTSTWEAEFLVQQGRVLGTATGNLILLGRVSYCCSCLFSNVLIHVTILMSNMYSMFVLTAQSDLVGTNSFESSDHWRQLLAVGRWFPPGTPVSSTRKLISSSSFHRLDMTLAVVEALNTNTKPLTVDDERRLMM